MIELTRYNETKFTLNAEIIEMVEETPDTVITLTTGKKIIVKESRQEVANLVKLYRYEIVSGSFLLDSDVQEPDGRNRQDE
ncbi:MAG: flagellar FlbD family protein [Lachnospiraceae bacterium]|nr:flagellar FlbD family protein [Lachnospiraceae bacterium]